MDETVVLSYAWDDLSELGHDFRQTHRGVRFTPDPGIARKLLDRLVELNHERYEEEVRAGLHAKGAKRAGPARRGKPAQEALL